MKVKVNIREFFEDNADHSDMLLAHASIDVDDLFDTNSIPEDHEFDIDIHELLSENRKIAHIWGIDDVQGLRPDLNDDQAWQVLQTVDGYLDSDHGVTWDTIKLTADELFGPKPEQRWHGRINVTITNTDGYGQDEVLTRLCDMAELLAKDMPDVQAKPDETSIRLADPSETTSK